MSDLHGVVVAHGGLAGCLVETVRHISGVEDALVPISNAGCSPDVLCERIREAVDDRRCLLFVDLASGSCALAARSVARDGALAVVTGVNLPMLLDFVFHRDMEEAALSRRLQNKGRDGIVAHTGSDAA